MDAPTTPVCAMCGRGLAAGETTCPGCGEPVRSPRGAPQRSLEEDATDAAFLLFTGWMAPVSPVYLLYGIVFLVQRPYPFPRKWMAVAATCAHAFWCLVGLGVLGLSSW